MKIKLKNVRLGFQDLFNAKSINGGEPKFTGTFICSDESTISYAGKDGKDVVAPHTKLNDLCQHVYTEKFGKVPAKAENWFYNKADGSTHRGPHTNDDGDYWAGFDKDTWYISASKKESMCLDGKMTVVDQHRKPIAANSGLMRSGVYVNVILDVYAYEGQSGKGLTSALEGVQLLRTGEPIGMTPIDAANEFDDEEMEVDENF
jgi:hypothetical protein